MNKNAIALVAVIIVCAAMAPSVGIADRATANGPDMRGTWSCETTQPNAGLSSPAPLREIDYLEYVGTGGGRWLHGRARPLPESTGTLPYYDYYLAYVQVESKREWVYIQIDPKNGYFVGVSDDPAEQLKNSKWRIDYPTAGGMYRFSEESDTEFTITRADLTQVCTKQSSSTPTPAPTTTPPVMKCLAYRTGQGATAGDDEKLSIKEMPNAKYWWQGVATDPNDGHVIYEYNIFKTDTQWVSIVINGTTGSFAVAMSQASKDLNNTIWDVVYPKVRDGFTFRNVKYQDKATLPYSFWVVFKDGYQVCNATPPAPSPTP